MSALCRVYWGSHGCALSDGHRGHHWCGCCPEDAEHRVAHEQAGADNYGADSCVGTWPYYGAPCMSADGQGPYRFPFFTVTGLADVPMPDEWDRLNGAPLPWEES